MAIVASAQAARWRDLRREVERLTPHDAASVLLRWFEIVKPPVDVEQLAQRLDVPVRWVADQQWLGAVVGGPEAEIWVDSGLGEINRRFTVAHELGHLLLHDVSKPRGCGSADLSPDASHSLRDETEASDFARSLLVPLSMLEDLVGFLLKKQWAPSDMFKAPEWVVRRQLKLLSQ